MIEKLEKDDLPGTNVSFSELIHRKNVLPLHDTGREIRYLIKKEVWAETRAIVSCNDGLRPVIMKLEATEEEAMIDYTPIER